MAENAEKDRAANLAIFKFFIQKFRAIIDEKSSGPTELALAVNGYGCFAAVKKGEGGGDNPDMHVF